MKKFIISLFAVLALGIAANAANYSVDEASIDAMIEAAAEVSPLAMENASPDLTSPTVKVQLGEGIQPIIAFILSAIPVTGWLACHRMYMGTSALAIILNIVTGGGFGVVYVVDAVMLLLGVLDNNISQYCDNGRWLMWANII